MPKIEAYNFRSYHSLDWEIPTGLTLIDGDNRDTGGSNMAGKSTLLDSWFWCRYGWLPKWGGSKGGPADAVIQRGQTTCRVKVTEIVGSDEIVIERARPNRVQVWKNGEEQKSLTQKELNVMLGMGPERFLLCVYISQKRKNSFYHMGDSDRTSLLSIVSGLEQLDEGMADAKKKRDVCKENITHFDGQKIAYDAQLNEIPIRVTESAKKKSDASIKLSIIKKSLEISEQERDKEIPLVQKEIAERVVKDTEPFLEKQEYIRSDIIQLNQDLSGMETSLDDTPRPEPELYANIKYAEADMLGAERASLEAVEIERKNERYSELIKSEQAMADAAKLGKCDSCDQDLPEKRKKIDYDRHTNKVAEYRSKIEAVPERPKLGPVRLKYDHAVEKLRDREYELKKLPDEIRSKIELVKAQLQAKKQEDINLSHTIKSLKENIKHECNERVRLMDETVNQLANETAYVQNVFNQAQDTHKSVLMDQTRIKDRLFEVEKKLVEQQEELNLALDLLDLFGPKGYRAVCFDGLVHRISQRAGELLQVMTEGLYSTYLEQIGQDSKGNQKLILRPVVLKGSIEVPRDDLSGGAEDRIALAYDVAVSEAAGDNMPLLLDEVLTALDAVGKNEAMTLLEEVSKSRPVLVIDHASEFKAMFTQVQKVVYKDGYSRLNDTTYNVGHESSG